MKVFLDDIRPAPPGWVRAYWPEEVIKLLKTGKVAEISLDHDLGDDAHGTGYDVILWIEQAVATRGFTPPKITVHSMNLSASGKMLSGIAAIERLHQMNLSRSKQATYFQLTQETVARLRKDFLALMDRSTRVTSFVEARKLSEKCRAWEDVYENILNQIRSDIQQRKRSEGDPEQAAYYLNHQKDLWLLDYELRNNFGASIPSAEKLKEDRDYFNKWQEYRKTGITLSEEEQFNQWMGKGDIRKWDSRVRAKARDAWKWLQQFAQWTDSYGGGGKPVVIQVPSKENVVLEGFHVQVLGWENKDFQKEGMEIFKAGLSFYRKRAAAVYPWILKNQIPLVADFSDMSGSGDAAATYKGSHINVSFWIIHENNPNKFAHAMAHEMGHHAWKVQLSSEGQQFWRMAVHGSTVPLDLREVLKKMQQGESLWGFEKRIQREDPILSLQLETLIYTPIYRDLDLISIQSIREYIEAGKNPIFRVPIEPISGYAGKNEGEAFAEVVGHLVGYGPRTVLPEVIKRFRLLVPEVRIASEKDAAGRKGDCFEAAGRYFYEHAIGNNNLRLVHGEVEGQGKLGGTRYGHAWVEDGDTVIDVSNGRNLRLPKQVYYLLGHISEIHNLHRYPFITFVEKMTRFEHWGPWDLVTSTGL
jgi:hypothetical protein